MNVFKYLGQDTSKRPANKVVQLVKKLEDVPKSKKEPHLDYFVQIKYDGVYCMIVKKGLRIGRPEAKAFGRTGKELCNVDSIIKTFVENDSFPAGVYMGEFCNNSFSLEQISGIVNPNRKVPIAPNLVEEFGKSYLMVHDYISVVEFLDGISDHFYTTRIAHLSKFFRGKILSNVHQVQTNPMKISEAEEFAKDIIKDGHEGVVIKYMNTEWVAGHKGWKAMKIVRGIDFDLRCIGVEEGTGKYAGKVANLLFEWKDGKTIKAMLGKGWTHEDAEQMWNDYICDTSDNPVDSIFAVYALQISSKGVLRLPKVGERRHDKGESDV